MECSCSLLLRQPIGAENTSWAAAGTPEPIMSCFNWSFERGWCERFFVTNNDLPVSGILVVKKTG